MDRAIGQERRAAATVAALLKLLVAAAALTGIVLDLVTTEDARGRLNVFSYFTIQSNLVVALVFIATGRLGLLGRRAGGALALVERCSRLWILLTGLAFHFLLSATWHPTGLAGISNLLCHYLVPSGVILIWLLLEPKGSYRLREAWAWIAYPFVYAVFSLLRGLVDGFYPYWFFDPVTPPPDGVGSYPAALAWAGALVVGFIVIGFVVTGIDALIAALSRGGKGKHRQEASS